MHSRGVWCGRVRRCGVTEIETAPDPVRVAASGTVAGAATAAAMLVAAAALAWFGHTAALYLVMVLTASAAAVIVTLARNRQDHVLLDDAGLTVVTHSNRVTHRWEDVLEIGWLTPLPLLPPQRPGLLVRPAAGGPFSVPGPTTPPASRLSPSTAAAPAAGCATSWPLPVPATASRSPRTAL